MINCAEISSREINKSRVSGTRAHTVRTAAGTFSANTVSGFVIDTFYTVTLLIIIVIISSGENVFCSSAVRGHGSSRQRRGYDRGFADDFSRDRQSTRVSGQDLWPPYSEDLLVPVFPCGGRFTIFFLSRAAAAAAARARTKDEPLARVAGLRVFTSVRTIGGGGGPSSRRRTPPPPGSVRRARTGNARRPPPVTHRNPWDRAALPRTAGRHRSPPPGPPNADDGGRMPPTGRDAVWCMLPRPYDGSSAHRFVGRATSVGYFRAAGHRRRLLNSRVRKPPIPSVYICSVLFFFFLSSDFSDKRIASRAFRVRSVFVYPCGVVVSIGLRPLSRPA